MQRRGTGKKGGSVTLPCWNVPCDASLVARPCMSQLATSRDLANGFLSISFSSVSRVYTGHVTRQAHFTSRLVAQIEFVVALP